MSILISICTFPLLWLHAEISAGKRWDNFYCNALKNFVYLTSFKFKTHTHLGLDIRQLVCQHNYPPLSVWLTSPPNMLCHPWTTVSNACHQQGLCPWYCYLVHSSPIEFSFGNSWYGFIHTILSWLCATTWYVIFWGIRVRPVID